MKKLESMMTETGGTFLENAIIKARAVHRQTGMLVLADDSGLEVEALDGEPGVRSARYAGESSSDTQNYEKVLTKLWGLPPSKRQARFICFMILVLPDGQEFAAQGECRGRILINAVGTKGFGYDPIFQPEGSSLSMAQLSMEEKNKISHRSQAIQSLIPALKDFIGNQNRRT
ncbi:MAG: RdgB/HAM1 family non-canonical purine NTP pyrophosphatase [Peptococcaceae bacterium]|nr:RdgB/HAM1 family non-canonical purine NTP pyrophosphatase [Peptococcaceae bacterium]